MASLWSSKTGLILAAFAVWGLALLSFALASSAHKECGLLEKKAASLESWKGSQGQEQNWDFVKTLQKETDPAVYAENLSAIGIVIDDFKEKTDPGGAFWEVSGHGTYGQICKAFAIISKSKNWSVMDLRELRREGDKLKFKARILTYRSRGNYEKKKYRSHRPHGNRQEPSSEDTV